MIIKLVSCSIVLLLVISLGDALEPRNLMMKPKGTIKTIQSIEDGDTIDCVDYYQQPAFDNLMLNKSQVHPSYIPSGIKKSNNTGLKLRQTWHKYGSCPDGTVPIRRGRNNRRFPKYSNLLDPAGEHEYATAFQNGNFYGGAAYINFWDPYTEYESEFNSSQIWVTSAIGTPDGNSVEAGLMVYPEKYGDARARLFVFVTNDNYENNRCYDLECDNFIQLPGSVALGTTFDPSSDYGGSQHEIGFNINKDPNNGHWWVYVNGNSVGYWSRDLFTSLSSNATEVAWGGEIINEDRGGVHTATDMGSGHLPNEGWGKASYFRDVRVKDLNHNWLSASFSGERVTNASCYDITVQSLGTTYKTYFLYGGPGLSLECLH